MKNLVTGILLFMVVGLTGCATSPRSSADRSEQASQKLILDDQRDIEKADANYKEIVLKHGESSHEAVKAKTELDNAKNKLAADQIHVQQLQRIESNQPSQSTSTPVSSGSQTEGRTTTTTTVTTTPPQ